MPMIFCLGVFGCPLSEAEDWAGESVLFDNRQLEYTGSDLVVIKPNRQEFKCVLLYVLAQDP